MMAGRDVTRDRLQYLERTVGALNGQLRDMQWELQRAQKGQSVTERFWKNLVSPGEVFMSAVCNRRIRPNTKVVDDGTARARQ